MFRQHSLNGIVGPQEVSCSKKVRLAGQGLEPLVSCLRLLGTAQSDAREPPLVLSGHLAEPFLHLLHSLPYLQSNLSLPRLLLWGP